MAAHFRHIQSPVIHAWVRLAVSGVLLAQIPSVSAESPEELARLEQQVVSLYETSKYPEAEPLAERLRDLTIQMHGEVSAQTASALHFCALMAQRNGDYDKAEGLWLKALTIDEKLFGADTIQTTRRLHMLATLYRDQGHCEKAVPLLNRALAIRERDYGSDHPETAQVVSSLGSVAMLSGDFAAAEAHLLRALNSFQHQSGYRWQAAARLFDLGRLYAQMGDFQRAINMLRSSLDLWRKGTRRENDTSASVYRELAMVYRRQGDLDEAEALLRQSLAQREKFLGTNHVLLAEVLEDLGVTYLGKSKLADAESALSRSRDILEQNLGGDHPQVASVLMALSEVKERGGDYETADEFCKSAFYLREKHFGSAHHLTLASLLRMACLDAALGRPRLASASVDQIQDGQERLFANILSFTSERQRLAFHDGSDLLKHRYEPWADLGSVQPLARSVLRTKGVVLDSLLEDQLIAETSDDAEVRELTLQLTQARRRLAQTVVPFLTEESKGVSQRADWEALTEETQKLEASLARRVAGFGRARRALAVQADQVQSAIPDQAVLLEMIRFQHYVGKGNWQERYGVLIFSRNASPRWVVLGSASGIERSIKRYQHAVRNPTAPEALANLLRVLYDELWVPLAPELPSNIRQVIVSPDGELNFVSFATLLMPAGCFLGEEYLFSYVACGRDLLVQNRASAADGQLLILANPDFGASSSEIATLSRAACNREFRDLSFRPLPGAEREGRLLCERAHEFGFNDAVLHLRSKATETELRAVQSPKVLHLATHGFVLPEIEATGSSDGAPPDSRSQKSLVPKFNPMSRSGLALAGAQSTVLGWAEGKTTLADHDGIVTADEIGGLNLRNTWLVVLSACDTGAGEARAGEGVLGLRRGFIQAGAENLLLTLWPIDDEETAGMMPEFYTEMQRTGSPADALARVQRTWLHKLRIERGVAQACRVAGPFILSFKGKPSVP